MEGSIGGWGAIEEMEERGKGWNGTGVGKG